MSDSQFHGDVLSLTATLRGLTAEVNELRMARTAETTHANSSITIDTGGATAWFSSRLAASCCLFMAGLSIGLSALAVATWIKVGTVESSVNGNKAYLSAIFQKNPALKAEIDKEKTDDRRDIRTYAD